jgi:hypothetical protein
MMGRGLKIQTESSIRLEKDMDPELIPQRFEGRVSVAGALIFLALCPFLLIFKKDPIAEKAAIWAYMFLVVGTIQMFVEYAKEEKKNVKLVE